MAWFMVDDKLHSHRKTVRANVEAMGLWVIAGSWCADQLTDGFIQDYMAERIDPKADQHAAQLVAAGLWHPAEKNGEQGWQFHDWDKFQPTRAEVMAKREAARERMAKARGNKGAGSQEVRANNEGTSGAVALTPALPIPTQPKKSADADAPPRADVDELCNLLADLVEANGSKRPNITAKWRDSARLMLDNDRRNFIEAKSVMRWSQASEFWKANVMSMPKFREKYDTLRLQAQRDMQVPAADGPRDQWARAIVVGGDQ